MRRQLLALATAVLVLGVVARRAMPAPDGHGAGGLSASPARSLRAAAARPRATSRARTSTTEQRDRAVDRGQPDEPERRRGRSGSRIAGPTAARTACWPPSATTAARRSPTRRRTSATALAAPRSTAATTAAPRTRGSRGRPTATCGRSPSASTARRRATPCWRRACATGRRRGASRSCCARMTRAPGVPLANNFNDKESLTADPTDADGNLVYAVWDRLVSPNSERAAAGARAHPLVARPDVVRAHDLGRRGDPGVGARPADLRPGRPQPDDLQPDRRAPERRR